MDNRIKAGLGYFLLVASAIEVIEMYVYQFNNPTLTQTQLFINTWMAWLFIIVQLWCSYKLIESAKV